MQTRLPEKLLLRVAGKSILQWTYEAARSASVAEGVTVAVDDPKLADEVDAFGGSWLMTSPDCARSRPTSSIATPAAVPIP